MRLSRFQHRETNNGKIVRAEIMKSRVFPDDTGTENLTYKKRISNSTEFEMGADILSSRIVVGLSASVDIFAQF